MANRVFDKDPDDDLVARCRIPQTELTDPRDAHAIAEKYSYEVIAEAWLFKNKACDGAMKLKHRELAGAILNQMEILTAAQSLCAREDM